MSSRILGVLLVAAVSCSSPGDGPKRSPTIATSPSIPSSTVRPPKASASISTSPSPIPQQVTKGAPLEPRALSPARSGDYLYDESGIQRIRGCLTSDRPPPTPTKMKVSSPDGSRQQIERDRRDSQGRGAIVTAILEYRADGVYLVFLRQIQSGLLSSVTEFEPVPPVLFVPNEPKTGQAWTFTLTSKDGQVKVETSNVVKEAGDKTVGIATTSSVTGESDEGSIDLKITSTSNYSRELRLATNEVTETRGRVGLCEVDSQEKAILRQ